MGKVPKIKQYGLLGKNIDYSFSRGYFSSKFKKEARNDCRYDNFDLQNKNDISKLLKRNDLEGINVTIPYKKEVLQYLDYISPQAKAVGAVNTICWDKLGKTTGHNTDVFGFEKALKEQLKEMPKAALILGSGGAAAAVKYVLKKNNINCNVVSRNLDKGNLTYEQLDESWIQKNHLIINTTPLGTYPNTDNFPPIPYSYLTPIHFLFDLIYNPDQTLFLQKGLKNGTGIQNGYNMLVYQAEKAWELWNH